MTDFLTEEERELALARANRDTSGDIGYHVNKSKVNVFVGWGTVGSHTPYFTRSYRRCVQGLESKFFGLLRWQSVRSVPKQGSHHTQIYLGGVIYFGANAALASISAFLPTIIKTFGYSEFSPLLMYSFWLLNWGHILRS